MEELGRQGQDWTRKLEARLIDSTLKLISELMVAWIKLVLDSATASRQAPLNSIVADGKFVGWRRWGTPSGSLTRLRARLDSFRSVVREARQQQMMEFWR